MKLWHYILTLSAFSLFFLLFFCFLPLPFHTALFILLFFLLHLPRYFFTVIYAFLLLFYSLLASPPFILLSFPSTYLLDSFFNGSIFSSIPSSLFALLSFHFLAFTPLPFLCFLISFFFQSSHPFHSYFLEKPTLIPTISFVSSLSLIIHHSSTPLPSSLQSSVTPAL